jgi:hypothetical protein
MITIEIKDKAEKLGLKEEDFDENINSLNELVHTVSGSGRLYRKTLKYIILNKIRTYLDNEVIAETDALTTFFPRRERRRSWYDFSDSFDLTIPGLRLTTPAIVILVFYCLTIGYFLIANLLSDTDMLVHVKLSGISLWPIFVGSLLPIGPIYHLGLVALPGRTIDDLIDGIIQKNMVDLLADDRQGFKYLIIHELSEG